jgi:transposase
MFVRQKSNKSGSTSIQIIDKTGGKYRVVETVGSSRDPQEVARLVELGEVRIARQKQHGQYSLFAEDSHDRVVIEEFVRQLGNASIRTLGPELIFGKLFDDIGFNAIPESLFRDVVVTRLVYPTSKLKTVDYLYRYQGKTVHPDQVYRFLDRLKERYFQQAQRIAYRHTRKILKTISVVFYDMTSLYFEAEEEDDLRKIGFSKDGKFQNPQIMLGLLVGSGGWPIGYQIYEGNTFEGKTMMPVLRKIQQKYRLGKPIVVADAAMLSKDNLAALEKAKYPFIVAARIRNETDAMQQEILARSVHLKHGESVEIHYGQERRLIVSYSDKRARKDAHNRQRGLSRLRKKIGSGKMTKEHLNNRGYNKFLRLTGEVSIEIDEAKIEQAARWDGLKGYLTNTKLSPDDIIENYGHLWQIERAFRISKTDLRIRPMYHRRRKRIEAHVLVAFVAYSLYKELQRRLNSANVSVSPKRAAELSQTMYEMTFCYPDSPEEQRVLLQMDAEQQQVYDAVHQTIGQS